MNTTSLYYPQLDTLRFLAFLLVLILHSPYVDAIPAWKTLHNYGWMGVDLFLCLSAFLFARLLFVEYQKKGKINVGHFYIRRGLRIWPLYFIFLGLMLVYTIYVSGEQNEVLARSLAMVTFTDNLLSMSRGYNYVILYTAHLWTISYEEQFYIVIPWALSIFYRLKKSSLLYLLSAITVMGMAIRVAFIYYQVKHPAIWVFPLTHFESVLGGLMLGLGLLDRFLERIPGWILLVAGLTSLGFVASLPNIDVTQWKLMLTYPLVGLGMFLLLFASLQGRLGLVSAFLRNKLLTYLGKISYGLYVYHIVTQPLANMLTTAFVSPAHHLVHAAVELTIRLFVTILFAMFSYQVLERPFLQLKERFTFIHSRPI